LKIIHVIGSLATGGAEKLAVGLCVEGIRQGHDCSIVTLNPAEGIPFRTGKREGISVTCLARSRWDPRIFWRLRDATAGADVVHTHLFPALYWSALLSKTKVFTEHDTSNRRRGNAFFWPFEKKMYSSFNAVVAISHGVASSLRQHLARVGANSDVSVVLNGVEGHFFTSETREKRPVGDILWIGSLWKKKDPILAVQAMSLLPSMKLDMVGTGPLWSTVEDEIQRLGLQGRVRLVGEVDNVFQVILSHELLLSTSAIEGFGLVALEAQASGIPVVGPAIPGFNEVVLDGTSGLLFADRSPATVARLIRAASEPQQYKRLSAGAVNHAKHFSIAKMFSSYLLLYESLRAKL
jgi:glycosyltransferase involved in cell wall biosynthesis